MSIIKHVTLQKIVAHDFRYDPRTKPTSNVKMWRFPVTIVAIEKQKYVPFLLLLLTHM